MFDFCIKTAPLVIFTLLGGCQEGRYGADAKFVDLYAELKLASVASAQDPSKTGEVQRSVLAQHGMTPAEFHERFMHLANHPDSWRVFQEKVISRMEAFQKERKGEALNGQ